MVDVTEINDEEEETVNNTTEEVEELPSVTRELDADEIEKLSKTADRPSVRAHLESLVSKLRRESLALKRVEASKEKLKEQQGKGATTTTAPTPSPVVSDDDQPKPQPKASSSSSSPPVVSSTAKYIPLDKFAFDLGSYNSEFITLYIDLPRVGTLKKTDQITCEFTSTSFDLIVRDLEGKSYRLFKDNLEKDINPDKCKYTVKKEKIVIKLGKVKGEYSYDSWQGLTAKKDKKKEAAKKADPTAGIMDLMKDMYDSGDDKMKKMIGETMLKQRNGELGKDMPGAGGLGGGLGDGFDDM